ncbi:MAG: hypothetical protein HY897_05345 [Deltaproteobacteria bacterium]|nr:hypothetical protein [Deltaproteobacteria bacterium]
MNKTVLQVGVTVLTLAAFLLPAFAQDSKKPVGVLEFSNQAGFSECDTANVADILCVGARAAPRGSANPMAPRLLSCGIIAK